MKLQVRGRAAARPRLLFAAGILLTAVHAQEARAPHESVADRVVAAVRDPKALRALLDEHEPWLVALELCIRGQHDAALAFARASDHPDHARLPEHIDAWRRSPVSPDDADALRAAERAFAAKDTVRAVAELRRIRADDVSFLLAWRRHRMARVAKRLNDPSAGARWEKLIPTAEAIGWLRGLRAAAYEAGDVSRRRGDFRRALGLWRQSVEVQVIRGDATRIARARMNLGILHAVLGDHHGAAALFEQCVEPLRKGRSRSYLRLLQNMGRLYERSGEYVRALRYKEKTRQAALAAGADAFVAQSDLLAAEVHLRLGDADRALLPARAALRGFEGLQDKRGTAQALGNLGLVLDARGAYADARKSFARARAVFLEIEDAAGAFKAASELARLHRKQGRLDEAERAHAELLDAFREHTELEYEARSLWELGQIRAARADSQGAQKRFRAALALAEEHGFAGLQAELRRDLATSLLDGGTPADAVAVAWRGVAGLARVLQGLADEQGSRARARVAGLFDVGLRAAAAAGDLASFAFFVESGRAGALLESLQGREALQRAAFPDELRRELAAARTERALARKAYETARKSGNRADLRDARATMQQAAEVLEAVVARMQREAKAAAGVLYPEARPLDEIRAALAEDESLVLYALADPGAYALVVARGGARLVDLGKTAAIRAACDTLDVTKPAPLRRLVVEPLRLEAKRVLVSPDGSLFPVPFALLLDKTDVACVASGTALALARASAAPRGRGVLALGDPDYGGRWPRLAASGAEARAVGDRVLLRGEASERALRTALAERRWRAVHLACHGEIDPARPMLSALLLTRADDDDGRLTAQEVFATAVPADLAVLSACESGAGRFYRGEGLVGFTRAFMVAGPPRVIVSLWKVDDDATRALMERFYELWKPGRRDAAGALRAAQAHVAAQSKWRAPRFWAAWQLWGLPN